MDAGAAGAADVPGATAAAAVPADVQAFFRDYRDAFDALDGDRVARLFALPSGIAQAGTYTHWTSPGPIRDNMAALCALYRERGYRGAAFEIATFLPQGRQYAVADVRWSIAWHDPARAPWRFSTTYNLVRTEAGWRVLLCTAYEEDRLFEAERGPRG